MAAKEFDQFKLDQKKYQQQVAESLAQNNLKSKTKSDFEYSTIFPRKNGPPGRGGIEITAKDGKNVSSPISNFYCSGYIPEQKYGIFSSGYDPKSEKREGPASKNRKNQSIDEHNENHVSVPEGTVDSQPEKQQSGEQEIKQGRQERALANHPIKDLPGPSKNEITNGDGTPTIDDDKNSRTADLQIENQFLQAQNQYDRLK